MAEEEKVRDAGSIHRIHSAPRRANDLQPLFKILNHVTLACMPRFERNRVRCLILACGNTLRSDDGVGPWLAAWAEERFATEPAVRIISRQQWTPDLAEEIASAESVVFVDCAVDAAPGTVRVERVEPSPVDAGLATHHTGAPELLALSEDLYASRPRSSGMLTIGAGSTEMGETFSQIVEDTLPRACKILESEILRILAREL
jgi:hydrogenase maturation protease